MENTVESFDSNGYAFIRSAINAEKAEALCSQLNRIAAAEREVKGDHQVPNTPFGYADPACELLLTELVPKIEAWSGRKVFPTYSYFRVYKQGDILAPHKDRPACEISLSLCLGYSSPEPWPLFVAGTNGTFAASMQPGDGVLYKGTECRHWREAFPGAMAAQVFLHYVDRNGPHAEWRNDKREQSTADILAGFLRRKKAADVSQPAASTT